MTLEHWVWLCLSLMATIVFLWVGGPEERSGK